MLLLTLILVAGGSLDSGRRLNPNMFGDGITVCDGKVYQLTWQNRMALVYKEEDLTPLEWFAITGEGWGFIASLALFAMAFRTLRHCHK